MLNLSPQAKYPYTSKGILVKSLRFIPSSGSNYISVYAQYGGCNDWVPMQIGLAAVPSLQQVRDVDRNISLNTGSYTDAHFYLRSADGNNINTAFFTSKDGGGIQSGDSTGAYVPLNLQPLGGLLNYGGNEVATKVWTQGQGYLTTETDPTVPSYVKSISPADISNWNGKENTANKSTVTTLGTSDVLFPTQKAVKTYVDTSITTNNANYIPLTQKGAVNGVASLGADGKIPNAQIPSIAISDTFVVNSQAAMLALSTAQTGDIAVRTDINESFILTNNTPGTLSSWQQLLSPTVTSTDQVPEGSTNLYFTTARARAAISLTGNGSYNATTGVINVNAETDPVYTAAIPNILMYKGLIGNAIDLNTFTVTGIYVQQSSAQAATGTNYPVPLAGKLQVVFSSSSFYWQEYHVFGSGTSSQRGIYRREYYSGAWTPWAKILDSEGTATVLAPYELLSNKTSNWLTIDNNKYPTTAAVQGQFYNVPLTILNQAYNISDWTKWDMSPANNDWTWHDIFAFAQSRYAYETTTDFGTTWTNAGIIAEFKQLLQQKQNVNALSLTNTAGVKNGIRCTFNSMAFSNLSYVFLHMSYTSPVCNFAVVIENSSDNATWTVLSSKTAFTPINSTAGSVFRLNTTPTATYVRVTIMVDPSSSAGSTAALTALRGMATRGGSGWGKEYEYPYSWTEDKYISVVTPTTTTAPGYDLALLNASGQITRGTIANILATTGIQNQQAAAQAANFWISGTGQLANIGLGTTPLTSIGLYIGKNSTGNTNAGGVFSSLIIQSDVTNLGYSFYSSLGTAGATFTLGTLCHFIANQGTFGAGSTVTNQVGFLVASNLIAGTSNYGFRGQIPAATGRWNMYMDGTAQNYFAGKVGIGVTVPNYQLDVNVGTTTATNSIARFTQNAGYVSIENGTGGVGSFLPLIKGVVATSNAWGLGLFGQGADTYTQAAVAIKGINTAGTGAVTSGKILSVQNYNTEYLAVDYTGVTTLANLSGTGTRIVTASATGVLSSVINNFVTGNIYTTDGTITGSRTVTIGSNLTFTGAAFSVNNSDSISIGTIGDVLELYSNVGITIGNASHSASINTGTLTSSTSLNLPATSGTLALTSQILPDTNFANTDLTATADRFHTFGAHGLTMAGTGWSIGGSSTGMFLQSATSNGLLILASTTNSNVAQLKTDSLTANRIFEFPNKAGTIALTTDVSALNLQAVATVGNSYLGDLLLGTSGNQINVGSGTVGSGNTRLGSGTLASATSGDWNTAIGSSALGVMLGSSNNTVVGESAMNAYIGATSAGSNSAFGDSAGVNMTEGTDNLFLGVAAGAAGETPKPGGDLNIFIGRSAGNFFGVASTVTLGSRNVYIGQNAGYGPAYAPLSDKLLIGNNPTPGTSVHIIEGSMVQGAQSLTFNSTVAISSLAGTGNRMVITDASGNLSANDLPSGIPQGGVTLQSDSVGLVLTDVSGCTEKFGEFMIGNTSSSILNDVLVRISYDVPYPNTDAKATISFASLDICATTLTGNIVYLSENTKEGFVVYIKQVPIGVGFKIDYNVVGY